MRRFGFKYDPEDPDALRFEPIPVPFVPGDLVLMQSGARTPPHVAVVDLASDMNDDGKITREEVFFIEAVSGHEKQNANYMVMNVQSWWSYKAKFPNWRFELRRLQTK